MAKYKENDVVQLQPGVVANAQLAVVQQVVTAIPARAATPDGAMQYQVLASNGNVVQVTGAQIVGKDANAPRYTTQDTFLTHYREALAPSTKGDEVFLTLPHAIRVTAPTPQVVNVVSPAPLLLFRGDDRLGAEDIFRNGFYNRKEVFSPSFKTLQGDVDGTTGTCASRRPEVGCLFPLQASGARAPVDPIRLYVLYAPNVYQTDAVQKLLLTQTDLLLGNASVKQRLELNAWAEEVIMQGTVPGNCVLGYYRVWRMWRGSEYSQGLEFKVDPSFIANANTTVRGSEHERLMTSVTERIKPLAEATWQLHIEETEVGGRVVSREWKFEKKSSR